MPMKWSPIPESERDFVSEGYHKDECYLRMNDFPDEPLWTLFYKGESIDFNDTPFVWKITYRR
jgi:hypothetical protein